MPINISCLALNLYNRGEKEAATRVFLLSTLIHPLPKAYNYLSQIAFEKKRYDKAAELLEQSLELDDKQARANAVLGQITAQFLNRPEKALVHLKKAVELDSGLETELAQWIEPLKAEKPDF